MLYFVATFLFMLVVIVIMAIGVIFGRHAIKGSCGGSDKGDCVCTEKCDKRKKQEAQERGDSSVINLDMLEKSSRH
jgi:uncharacterized protein